MAVSKNSMIPDYIKLDSIEQKSWATTPGTLWVPKQVVALEIEKFIVKKHNIKGEHHRAERGKNLKKILRKIQKILNDRRYENWRILNELFMQYYETIESEP